jgi:GT2 family glycosyltransferase
VGDARLEAFRQAACHITAFLEDHVIPQPGWLQAVLAAFARSEKIAIVNYAFINPRPDSYVSRAFTLLEYGHWIAPGPSGPIAYACHHNLAYRKSVFLDAGASDPELLESEFLIHRRLLDAGWTIWYAADAVVAHETWTRVRDGVRANARMKRVLACVRSRDWGLARRMLYAAGMVIVPALLLLRLARSIARRPALWGEFIHTLPLMAFTYTICSIWEAAGYLFGQGAARSDFAQVEYRAERGP